LVITVLSCLFPKVKNFAKDFRVGAILSYMVPVTITAVLTLLSNVITGTGGLIFAIFSIFAALLALAYFFYDIANAVGKCGWNTSHMQNMNNGQDRNLAYNPSYQSQNNSRYLLKDGTYRQFDMDKISRTRDSKMDFFEIILNFLKAGLLALTVKAGIGSPLIILLLTGILAGLFWKTYSDRQKKLENLAQNPNNPYHKLKQTGQPITDALCGIQKWKAFSVFARIGYILILLSIWLFGSMMSLSWIQILTVLFTFLVLTDVFCTLVALGKRLKRCGDMYSADKNQNGVQSPRREAYTDSETTV
jgi:hypothetical protein